MSSSLNLDSLANLDQALQRVDDGLEALRLVKKLGLWTDRDRGTREPFPRTLAQLTPDEVSDLAARVAAELGLLYELVGVLRGLRDHLKVRSQQVRGRARTTFRRKHQEQAQAASTSGGPALRKALTKAEVDDGVEDDADVRAADQQYSLVALLLASAEGALNGGLVYKETISREITMRGNLIAGGIH